MVDEDREAHFHAYGTSFAIQASDEELIAAVRSRASMLGWRDSSGSSADLVYVLRRRMFPESSGPPAYQLTCHDGIVRTTTDLEALLDAFENDAKLQTAAHARGVLFVHAGVVAWKGHGILIPGRSRAGKSTLVHALLQAGAEYYSDEFALLDTNGRVHPYPVPLSLRASSRAPSRRIHAETLGARVAQSPTFVDVIVATQYRRRARWRPRRLSKGDAFILLMENTIAARQPPARTMPILRDTVLRATAVRSWRGEAQIAARQLLASLS
jgi:hypothetical protein